MDSESLDMKIEPELVLLVLESKQRNAIIEALGNPGNHFILALNKLSEAVPEAKHHFQYESGIRHWRHVE